MKCEDVTPLPGGDQLDKPSIDVRVSQRGRKLQVEQSTTGPGEISYSRIYPDAKSRGSAGPEVTVMRANAPGTPLVSGNMKYG